MDGVCASASEPKVVSVYCTAYTQLSTVMYALCRWAEQSLFVTYFYTESHMFGLRRLRLLSPMTLLLRFCNFVVTSRALA